MFDSEGAPHLVIKNTFLEYEVPRVVRRCSSEPCIFTTSLKLEEHLWNQATPCGGQQVEVCGGRGTSKNSTRVPSISPRSSLDAMGGQGSDELQEMIISHSLGGCKPCSYFHFKEDGCRLGDACSFCHLCEPEEAKSMKLVLKKEQRKMRRQREARENRVGRLRYWEAQELEPDGSTAP
eukprot:CAMPEP_0197632016 /NCGR_PEP_ID=MMETSP1338-20131121/8969_1 /TAXON_ID=43686 ORGANISM="Pelagodinium beii, Strain RCC1491" /NCGR_SAMPLE_ID=MMETSP1338 /ASSEMBLY_ACC=CAM_ASM_000754 /LENGTH=178 /DNA_ID=CAMNT_0043203563 /DNA_START=52 /DNA_END=588 /DNA_ORIENTATION=+